MSKNYVEAKLWDPDVDPVYTAKSGGNTGVMMGVTAIVVVATIASLVLFGPFGGRTPSPDVYDPNAPATTAAQPGDVDITQPPQYEPEPPPPGQNMQLPPQEANPDLERGIALYLGGQHQAAIAHFDQVIRSDANSVNAFVYRGRSYQSLNNFHAAVSDFTQAHRRAPNNADILTQRGGSYFRLGFHAEAIADLSRAIELDQNNLNAREYRARTFEAMGNHSAAQADYNAAAVLRQQQAMGGVQ